MPVKTIQPRELKQLLDRGQALLVDVHEPAEFRALAIGLVLLPASGLILFWNELVVLAIILIGAGLTIAGVTGFCGLARLMALAPRNK